MRQRQNQHERVIKSRAFWAFRLVGREFKTTAVLIALDVKTAPSQWVFVGSVFGVVEAVHGLWRRVFEAFNAKRTGGGVGHIQCRDVRS